MVSDITYLFFSLLFLTTSISKIIAFRAHVKSVNDYKIFPEKYSPLVAFTGLLVEILSALLLLLPGYQFIGLFLGILLLLVFTLGIATNLRNENSLNCGCGGVIGNKRISISDIYRNITFILILLLLMIVGDYGSPLTNFLALGLSVQVLLIFYLYSRFQQGKVTYFELIDLEMSE